jgi:hypothetical protein
MDEKSLAISCKKLAAIDRPRFISSIEMIQAGAFEEDLIAVNNFTYREISALAAVDPGVKTILKEARAMGNEARQVLREDTADRRAIHGTKEPIYSLKGDYVGEKTNYSDTLLSLQLKANDPAKYRDAAPVALGGGFVLAVNLGLERDPVDRLAKTAEIKCVDLIPTPINTGGLPSNGVQTT